MMCDRAVFFASKARTCTEGLLRMRTYRIGNLFLKQVKGIPIGGPISGAILDLVLARAECHFDLFVRPKVARRWNLTGPGKGGSPSGDTLMISSVSPGGFVQAAFVILSPLSIEASLFSTPVTTGGASPIRLPLSNFLIYGFMSAGPGSRPC